jgi:hypothetical protein
MNSASSCHCCVRYVLKCSHRHLDLPSNNLFVSGFPTRTSILLFCLKCLIPCRLLNQCPDMLHAENSQERILHAKEKCNWIVSKQVHAYNTRNNDYLRCVRNLKLKNSKPSVAGHTFYNKLPNIKQIGNNNQFKRS